MTLMDNFWQSWPFLTMYDNLCQFLLIMTMTLTRHKNESSKDNDKDNLRDLWDINHSWESEFRTIWQLRVTQDSICNSCDVLKHSAPVEVEVANTKCKPYMLSAFWVIWSHIFRITKSKFGQQQSDLLRRCLKYEDWAKIWNYLQLMSTWKPVLNSLRLGFVCRVPCRPLNTHAMSQRGEAVAVCVTWADLLSGYQLLWKTFFSCNTFSDKRKLETKHLYLGQPHSWPGHTSHWYQISCFPER